MKFAKSLIFSSALVFGSQSMAHDEGHGPKLTYTGKFGGLTSAVVEKKDASLGAKAKLQYKAELVRSNSGKVQVYLYDADMNPVDASAWNKNAKVLAAPLKKGSKSKQFEVVFDGKAFTGNIPDGVAKPFNLDFTFTAAGRELLSAFDNLD